MKQLNPRSFASFAGAYPRSLAALVALFTLIGCDPASAPEAPPADAAADARPADTSADAEAADDAATLDAQLSDANGSDGGLDGEATVDSDGGRADDDAGPSKTFAIAAIADPHITGTKRTTANYKRLQAAVAWLNQERDKRGIELVLVLGDIGWSGGLKPARAALDKLKVPYLPTIGDNCLHAGDEEAWDDVFGPVYAGLAAHFPGLSRGVTPTTHGTTGKQVILQNISFDLFGVHVIALDLSPREKLGLIGELGDIHDYPGGSWPWLQQDIAKVKDRPVGSVLIASHIPMHQSAGALDAGHMVKVKALAATAPKRIHASIAGHYHVDAVIDIPSLAFPSYVVGSVFAGPLPVHIATATVTATEVTWTHETIALPGYPQP